MVKHPIEYPWSSYAANAEGKKVEWLTPHGEYLGLGSDESTRLAAYQKNGVRLRKMGSRKMGSDSIF